MQHLSRRREPCTELCRITSCNSRDKQLFSARVTSPQYKSTTAQGPSLRTAGAVLLRLVSPTLFAASLCACKLQSALLWVWLWDMRILSPNDRQ